VDTCPPEVDGIKGKKALSDLWMVPFMVSYFVWLAGFEGIYVWYKR
jgi:hypothetical protein